MIEFKEFPKIARLTRNAVITEKIDGTNGCIFINGDLNSDTDFLVGSRTRWITPECDNHGFAKWAYEHKAELMGLGPGLHFGEWWGAGIQRGYGLPKGDKRFSLFNTVRWCLSSEEPKRIENGDPTQEKYQQRLPPCCHLVPVIMSGLFSTNDVDVALTILSEWGSIAAPGYMNPEGVVVYHEAGNIAFKKTLGRDGHKSLSPIPPLEPITKRCASVRGEDEK